MDKTTFAGLDNEQSSRAMNRVFQGYLVPIDFSPRQMEMHVACNDIDLSASPLWLDDDGNALGAALLGIRGDRGWIGGFGIAPELRGRGAGLELAREVQGMARERGARELMLEVLSANAPAIALYRKAGFSCVRDLFVYEAAGEGNAGGEFRYADPDDFLDLDEPVEPCWQRERQSLRNGSVTSALTDDAGTFALFRFNDTVTQVRKLAAVSAERLRALTHALRIGHDNQTITLLNEPTGSSLLPLLDDAGWTKRMTQFEMQNSGV